MKNLLFVLLVVLAGGIVFGQVPDAMSLLKRMESNENYNSIEYEGEMIIEHGGRRFEKKMKAWGRGTTQSFIEFINPEDRGTKYLRTGGRLYVYSPDSEGVLLISGHMLRESMMGSDMSYEDTMDNDPLSKRYNAAVSGSETVSRSEGSRDCWVLDLKAKKRTESYPSRRLWIDKETEDCLRYELFALSGAKLKDYNMLRIEVIGGKRFPVEIEIRDLLRKNSKTTLIMRNAILDKPIEDSVFSMRNLER